MPTDKDRECLLAAQHALERAEVILKNMAMENVGWRSVFGRWPISHEPLRRDAHWALPEISRALIKVRYQIKREGRFERIGDVDGD